ncbi:MAG: flagellar basal body rod C-terminal domain-containing protein [Parvularcula sp.]|jgi:flagellar hook-associated protein 1 FlgK|nr:flagellar basal body rod C-terminal domain-containing protein [Parvularcula sp.]
MSLSTALHNSLMGMSTASFRAELTSFNIAHAGQADYGRRSLVVTPGLQGGIANFTIDRADAGRSEAALLARTGQEAEASVLASASAALFEAFGDPEALTGLYGAVADLEGALRDLQTTPESPALQESAVGAVRQVAVTFEDVSTEIEARRLEADGAIASEVASINEALAQLRELNASAARATGTELSTVAESQRAVVHRISAALAIKVEGEYGDTLSIRTTKGVLLLGAEVRPLRFDAAGSMEFEARFADGDLSGLSVDGIDITPGTPQGAEGGRLAAQFAFRDVVGTDAADRLDAVARDLYGRLAIADTTDPEGLLTLLPGNGSAAERLRLHPGIDPASGGEAWRIRDGVGAVAEGPSAGEGRLGSIRDALAQPLSNLGATGSSRSYSFAGLVAAVGDQFGALALRTGERHEQAVGALSVQREAVLRQTGVDTDRELQELLMIEQAFAANARVAATIDEMLARLMEI